MGIQGLLPMLKSITSTVHVSMYSGRRVAIDAYGWLHKGAYSCSRQLCEGTPTEKCGLSRNAASVPQCSCCCQRALNSKGPCCTCCNASVAGMWPSAWIGCVCCAAVAWCR